MKRTVLAVLFCLLASAAASHAANHVVEARSNNRFSPQDLTIEVGDTVTWTNAGGLHNVVADDGSFRCADGCDGSGGDGDPSSSAWSFTLTFNQAGTTTYNCEVHVTLGMVGSITVEEGMTTEPGSLRFAQGSLQIDEDGGSASLTVNRVNGRDGAVSVSYSTSNGSATAGSDYTAASGTLNWSDDDAGAKSISVAILDDADDESNETINVLLSSPAGGATLGNPSVATVTIVDDDQPSTTPRPGTINFASPLFEIDEDGERARISVTRSDGRDGAVSVAYETSAGSATAGSDYSNRSGTLTWADGDGATKRFNVPIIDDSEEEATETVNLMLSNPTGGATLGDTSTAALNIEDDDMPPVDGSCTADAKTLCLGRNNRFRARVFWATATGAGDGQAVDIGRRDSGLFFFFSEDNIEMLLKVLDGCGFNDHFWVFFAATTNVEFSVTVTDTEHGESMTYTNELGHPANAVTDTSAFATCP